MEPKNSIDRRRFMGLAGAAGMAVALAGLSGCSSQGTSASPSAATIAASGDYPGKIDAYCHFAFQPVMAKIQEIIQRDNFQFKLFAGNKYLMNPEDRIELMDKHGVERSVIEPLPEIGTFTDIVDDIALASEVTRLINEEASKLVAAYPERFSASAALPTVSPEAAAAELNHAVNDLGLCGGFIGTGPFSLPMDDQSLDVLWAKAVELDVPIWIHPCRPAETPDYRIEQTPSAYQYYQIFGWVADDTLAAYRMVMSGVFERYPDLKVILHHHGAMIPYFVHRLDAGAASFERMTGQKFPVDLEAPYADHFKKFYVDTATQGVRPDVLKVAVDFFGVDQVLFGTDCPLGAEDGGTEESAAIESVLGMNLGADATEKIFRGNALRVLGV